MNRVPGAATLVLAVAIAPAQDSRPDPGRYGGQVLDARLLPVAQAVIEVMTCDGRRLLGSGRSEGAGEFIVTRLPTDTQMLVRVCAAGLTEHRSLLMLSDHAPRTRGGEIVLYPAGRITGRVVDPEGRPVAGARLAATLRAGYLDNVPRSFALPYWPGEAVSGADGRYAIERAPLGAVTVRAWQSGYLLAETAVELHGESVESPVVLTRGEGARLRVQCQGMGARDLLPLFLMRTGKESGCCLPPLPVAPDADGVLVLGGMPAGRYTLHTERWDLQLSPPQHEIELQGGETRTVEWAAVVPDPSPVTGRVTGPDGKPLAGMRVAVQRPRGWPRSIVVTDAQGRFRAATPTARGEQFMVYLIDDAWDLEAGHGILMVAAAPERVLELAAVRRRRLDVVVVDRQDRPVPRADATLFRGERGEVITNSWTDARGRCQFFEVDRGGELCLDVESRAGHAIVRGIELPRADVLRVVIAPAAVLGGVVRDATGRPFAGARLLVLEKDAEGTTALKAECVSDRLGRFRFPGLRGGGHVVQVFANGGSTPQLEHEIAIEDGQAQDAVVLTLR